MTKCPTCGGKLLTRTNSKNGQKFLGCSNYPECRYTESRATPKQTGDPCPKCGTPLERRQWDATPQQGRKNKLFYYAYRFVCPNRQCNWILNPDAAKVYYQNPEPVFAIDLPATPSPQAHASIDGVFESDEQEEREHTGDRSALLPWESCPEECRACQPNED
jgi:ssDNA-binding Zn-finger/Zn-ribbon topoisomerase 1